MRKKASSLEEARIIEVPQMVTRRGKATIREVTGNEALSDFERRMKQELCCYLKAQDFGYRYMATEVGMAPTTVRNWFAQEDWMRAKVEEIRADILSGAVTMLKDSAIELVQMLMGIARKTADEELAVKVMQDLLDRLGLSKVNKSQSVSANINKDEVDITDRTGLLEKMRSADPHTQAAIAEKLEDALSMVAEHTS